jgi:hypothetical protein
MAAVITKQPRHKAVSTLWSAVQGHVLPIEVYICMGWGLESLVQFFKRYNILNDEFQGYLPKCYLQRHRLASEHYANTVTRRRRGQCIGFKVDHHLLCLTDGLHNRIAKRVCWCGRPATGHLALWHCLKSLSMLVASGSYGFIATARRKRANRISIPQKRCLTA